MTESSDIKFRIIRKKPPEGSGAPPSCNPNYIEDGEEPPEGVNIYEGPNEGEFYCTNYADLNDFQDGYDSSDVSEEVSIEAWGLPGTNNLESVDPDDIEHGDVVVFETEEGKYTGQVSDIDGETATVTSTLSGESLDVPVDRLEYLVEGASDRDLLEFRFGNVEYNDLDDDQLSSVFNIPEHASINKNIDDVEPGSSILINKPGFGSIYGSVINLDDDDVTVGTYDSKISGTANGSKITIPKDKFESSFIASVDGAGLKELTESISGVVSDENSASIEYSDLEFGDDIFATIQGYGNIKGRVFNTEYSEEGTIGIRASNGAGQDKFIWVSPEDIQDLRELNDDLSAQIMGTNFSTLQFPADAQLERTEADASFEDGEIALVNASGTQVAGVVDSNDLLVDPDKYNTINETDEGYVLRGGFGENIELESEGSHVRIPVDDSWIGRLNNVEEIDVLKGDPDDWDFEREVQNAGASTTLREFAKDSYQTKVNTSNSDTSWSKFIQEGLERGGSGLSDNILDAIMNATTLLGELGDKTYDEGFDDLDSTRQRRREKFELIERSSEEAFSQASKVEVADAPNEVSFGYYKRKERGEDNFDYFNELFSDDMGEDMVSHGNEVYRSYSASGSRAALSSPIYHAIAEETGYKSYPTYYDDVNQIAGEDPIDYWEDAAGGDFVEDLDQEDFQNGKTMVQYREDSTDHIEGYDSKKEAVKKIREKTQELLKESLPGDSIPLYRAVGGDDVVSEIQNSMEDDNVTHYSMEQETINSWTSSPEKALMFGNNKSGQKHSKLTDNFAIVRADIPIDRVAAFSEFTEGLDTGGQSEFIVEGSEEGLEIPTDDIITGQGQDDSSHMFELPDDPSMFEEKMKSIIPGISKGLLKNLRSSGFESEEDYSDASLASLSEVKHIGHARAMNILHMSRDESIVDPYQYDQISQNMAKELHDKGLVSIDDYWNWKPGDGGIGSLPGRLQEEIFAGRGSKEPDWDELDGSEDLRELSNTGVFTHRQIEDLIDNGIETKDDMKNPQDYERLHSLDSETSNLIRHFGEGNSESVDSHVENIQDKIEELNSLGQDIKESAKEYEGNSPDAIRYPTEEITLSPEDTDLDEETTAQIPKATLLHLAGWSIDGLNNDRKEKSLSKEKNVKQIDIEPESRDWIRASEENAERGVINYSGRNMKMPSSPSIDMLHNISLHVEDTEVGTMVKSTFAGVIEEKIDELRKWRIYVDNEEMIPEWAEVIEGPRGGIYYVVHEQELVNELLSPPMHEVGPDFDLEDYDLNPTEAERQGQARISEYSYGSNGAHRVIERANQYENEDDPDYWRIYVDDKDDVPEWAKLRGPNSQGNYYYRVHDEGIYHDLITPPEHQVSDEDSLEEYLEDNGDKEDVEEKEGPEREYWRVYVDNEEEAPDWANVVGPSSQGNLYYIVYDEELFSQLVHGTEHEVDDYDIDSYLEEVQGDNIEEKLDDPVVIKRKFKIYVEDGGEVPEWAQAHVGPWGGVYYIVYYKPLFNALMEEPKHEIPSDFDLRDYMYNGPGEGVTHDTAENEEPDEKSKGLQIIDVTKRRIYIDEAADAPDGKQVHRGDKGGLYYVAGSESAEDESEEKTEGEYHTHSNFGERLADAIERGSIEDITPGEYGESIDTINDGDLLEDAYRLETREAVRREIENWADQLNRHFEYSYQEEGPRITDSGIKTWKQVESLCDKNYEDDDISAMASKMIDEWEEYAENGVSREERNKFRERVDKVDNEVVIYDLWERGYNHFTDLNTILENALTEMGYSVRTEVIPGNQRRLDLKYNYRPDENIEGEFAEDIESGQILLITEQEDWSDKLSEIDNIDFLNDAKTAIRHKGASKDSIIVKAIKNRISDIGGPVLDEYDIEPGVYRKIINRPAGFKGTGQGINKKCWGEIWNKVSTEDLEEFCDIAEARNNFAHLSIVRGMLVYRQECSTASRDMTSLTYKGGDIDEESLFTMLEHTLSRLDPVVGSHLLAYITAARGEKMSGNKEGYVLFRGEMAVDGRKTRDNKSIEVIFAHCVGHILHDLMGLDNKEIEDNSNESLGDGLGYSVIQPKNEYNSFIQDFYEKIRKEWTRYTSQDEHESRIYQRINPAEFFAALFAIWITDPEKLKLTHEPMSVAFEAFFAEESDI